MPRSSGAAEGLQSPALHGSQGLQLFPSSLPQPNYSQDLLFPTANSHHGLKVKILHRGRFFLGVLGSSGSNSLSLCDFPSAGNQSVGSAAWLEAGRRAAPFGVEHICSQSQRGALERCREGGRGLCSGTSGHASLFCYFKRNPIPKPSRNSRAPEHKLGSSPV